MADIFVGGADDGEKKLVFNYHITYMGQHSGRVKYFSWEDSSEIKQYLDNLPSDEQINLISAMDNFLNLWRLPAKMVKVPNPFWRAIARWRAILVE